MAGVARLPAAGDGDGALIGRGDLKCMRPFGLSLSKAVRRKVRRFDRLTANGNGIEERSIGRRVTSADCYSSTACHSPWRSAWSGRNRAL
jgi:hypothetical protein